MVEERLHKVETQIALNSQHLNSIANKVEDMPTKDETKLMFIEETRKLIDGMGTRITKVEGNQKYVAGFGAGIGLALDYIIHLFK